MRKPGAQRGRDFACAGQRPAGAGGLTAALSGKPFVSSCLGPWGEQGGRSLPALCT